MNAVSFRLNKKYHHKILSALAWGSRTRLEVANFANMGLLDADKFLHSLLRQGHVSLTSDKQAWRLTTAGAAYVSLCYPEAIQREPRLIEE